MAPSTLALLIVIAVALFLRKRGSSNTKKKKKIAEDRWHTERNVPSRVATKPSGRAYLVTGGAGFLGGHVVEALLARGETNVKIFDVRRSPLPFDSRVQQVVGSLEDRNAVEEACKGVECVIHTAFAMLYYTRAGFDTAAADAANVEGTKNLVDACIATGVKTLVLTSSNSAVFNAGDEKLLGDESAPYTTRPVSHYARTKALAERAVLAADNTQTSSSGVRLRTAAIRVSGIFGPRDGVMGGAFHRGVAVQIGSGSAAHDFVYVENVVHGHLLAEALLLDPQRADAVGGKPFYVCNGGGMQFNEFAAKMAHAFEGTAVRWVKLPMLVVVPLMHAVAAIYYLTRGRFPQGQLRMLQPPAIHMQRANVTYSDARARSVLGYVPLYTVDEGCAICASFSKRCKEAATFS